MEEWLVPLVAIICAVGLPVLLLMILVIRTTRTKHEERMAMIEKGIVLEEPERKTNKFNALRNGLLMIGWALWPVSFSTVACLLLQMTGKVFLSLSSLFWVAV